MHDLYLSNREYAKFEEPPSPVIRQLDCQRQRCSQPQRRCRETTPEQQRRLMRKLHDHPDWYKNGCQECPDGFC